MQEHKHVTIIDYEMMSIPLHEINAKSIPEMLRPSAALSSAAQDAMPPEIARKRGVSRLTLPTLLHAGNSVKQKKKKIKIFHCSYFESDSQRSL